MALTDEQHIELDTFIRECIDYERKYLRTHEDEPPYFRGVLAGYENVYAKLKELT